jgi:hypothetical protein
MRKAAHEGNSAEFHRHLGDMFSKDEAKSLESKVKEHIASGAVKLKR